MPTRTTWRHVPRKDALHDVVEDQSGRTVCSALPRDAQMIAAGPRMVEVLQQVEEWWLTRGMHVFGAAPPCVAEVRKVIHEATQP